MNCATERPALLKNPLKIEFRIDQPKVISITQVPEVSKASPDASEGEAALCPPPLGNGGGNRPVKTVRYWCLCEASNRGMSRPGTVGLAATGDTRARFEASKISIIGLSRGSSFRISSHIVT
jgi:hypothetical protein